MQFSSTDIRNITAVGVYNFGDFKKQQSAFGKSCPFLFAQYLDKAAFLVRPSFEK